MNPDTRVGPALRYLLVGLALAFVSPFAPSWAACTAGTPLANVVEETPSADFTANGDGTVIHLKTGRMWKQCTEGLSGAACATGAATLMNWGAALGSAVAANNANFAGHNDWRLPDIKELVSVIETCGSNRAINTVMFPNTPAPNLWSSSTYAQYSPNAWAVNFTVGSSLAIGKAGSHYARLVRGGQFADSFDSLKTASMVTYNGNGSSGGSVPVGSISYANGATVTVLGNTGSLVKTGATFAGWNTVSNGSGANYPGSGDANFTIGVADVTLYAQWMLNTYTVSFNTNGGSPVASQSVLYNGTATAPAAPTKAGSTFAGWYADAGLTSAFTFGTSISGNVTLYVNWTPVPTYGVAYDGNSRTGGNAPADGNSYPTGAPVTVLGNAGNLVKTGSTFVGWNTAANGSGTSYPGTGSATFTMGSGSVTLFALWSTGGCTLDVDGNGVIDALTDGLMLIRAQFGLTGSAVTSGAVAAGAARSTWAQIQPYLNANCGTSFAP